MARDIDDLERQLNQVLHEVRQLRLHQEAIARAAYEQGRADEAAEHQPRRSRRQRPAEKVTYLPTVPNGDGTA